MKTLKKVPVELIRVEFIPDVLEFGKIYYSEEYLTSCHSCLCGCGQQICIPIKPGEWTLTENNGKVSISPSLLQRHGCKSHYIIRNNIANFV